MRTESGSALVGRRTGVGTRFALLALLVAACGRAPQADREVAPTVPATEAPTQESALDERLDAILPAETDAPAGMVFDAEDLGAAARDHLLSISPSEVRQAVEQGWVDAVLRQWWTPEFFEAINSGVEFPKKKFKQSGNWTFLSGASAYEDAESAAAALEAYLEDYRANWDLTEAGKAMLGDEGAILEGPNPIGGAPQVVYVWRHGPYILHVLATGSVEADADQIRAIAQGMQDRAEGEVTVTLRRGGCRYEGLSEVPAGPLTIRMVNETAGQFDMDLWLLNEGHTYDELASHIAEEQRRDEAGESPLGHPTFATLVAEATTDAGGNGELATQVTAGTYGMACILFPAPGSRGGIWAAGPFTVSG